MAAKCVGKQPADNVQCGFIDDEDNCDVQAMCKYAATTPATPAYCRYDVENTVEGRTAVRAGWVAGSHITCRSAPGPRSPVPAPNRSGTQTFAPKRSQRSSKIAQHTVHTSDRMRTRGLHIALALAVSVARAEPR